MENYYSLSWKDNNSPIASAFAPEGTKLAQDLISELDDKNELPFDLSLIKLDVGKNGLIKSKNLEGIKDIWWDYQPNSLAWPLMSEKLKLVVENNLVGSEQIDWISCNVKGNNDERKYFIPRFNKILDVLDVEKTTFLRGSNRIIRPVFAYSKIINYSIFPEPASKDYWKISFSLYVSETLKKSIKKQKLIGVIFEKASVS